MEYQLNVVKNAIERGELKECMMGMGKYRYADKNIPGPFNEEAVLDDFYSIYENNPEMKADVILENTLREMLDGNIKEIYTAIFYTYSQKYYEKKGLAKFILDNNILNKINRVVHDKKAELEATDDINEFYIHQNIMKVLVNYNNRSKNELGIVLFTE